MASVYSALASGCVGDDDHGAAAARAALGAPGRGGGGAGRIEARMAFPDLEGLGRGSDSCGLGRIPSSPAGELFAVDSDKFGRGSGSGGFLDPEYVLRRPRIKAHDVVDGVSD